MGPIAQFLGRATGLHRQAASLLLDAQAAVEDLAGADNIVREGHLQHAGQLHLVEADPHVDRTAALEVNGRLTPIYHCYRQMVTNQRHERRASPDRRNPGCTIPVASGEDPQPLASDRQRLTTDTVESRMR